MNIDDILELSFEKEKEDLEFELLEQSLRIQCEREKEKIKRESSDYPRSC